MKKHLKTHPSLIKALLLIFLLVITAYIFTKDFSTDHPYNQEFETTSRMTIVGLIFALLLPIYFVITYSVQVDLPNSADTEKALNRIKRFTRNAVEKGDEVVFIDERQLLPSIM